MIPSFLIFDLKVERLSPDFDAAPRGPPMIQLVSRRTCRMCVRSASSSFISWPLASAGAAEVLARSSGSATRSSGPGEGITARSSRLWMARAINAYGSLL